MQAGTFALFMGLISCVHCVLLISLFQRDYETVNFNNLLLPRHYDDLPTRTQGSLLQKLETLCSKQDKYRGLWGVFCISKAFGCARISMWIKYSSFLATHLSELPEN